MHKVIKEIFKLLPLQGKKLINQLDRLSSEELQALDDLCDSMEVFLENYNVSDSFIAESYKNLNNMMLQQQIFFKKHCKYKSESQNDVNNNLYSVQEKMIGHMISLALTQFLWKNHYEMMNYFKNKIIHYLKNNSHILEIGAGHGLFTKELLNLNYELKIDILDISNSSIELSKQIIKSLNNEIFNSVNFIHADITKFKTDIKYDFISMSEVLEHVDKPQELLNSLNALLADDGIVYLTTCANCPSSDHVYLFNTIDEIRNMIKSSGFKIVDELMISAENVTIEEAERLKLPMNYSSFLRVFND